MSEERTLYKGSPSQVVNAGVYLLCGVLALADIVGAFYSAPWVLLLLLAPAAWAGWCWLQLRSRVYEITTERIRVSTGILTRRTDDLELYRVEDITLVEPLALRLVGLGNLELATNDTSSPKLVLPALRGVKQLREDLRRAVEECRERKRVRVTEMESGPGSGH
jgi:uncharacterized membrane protein YdbT with pleckstrin-like domain